MSDTTLHPAMNDTWVLNAFAEQLTEEFHRFASNAQVHEWEKDRAHALASQLAFLHGLSGGRLGMSAGETEVAIYGGSSAEDEPLLCDGCGSTDKPVQATDDGRALACPDCLPVANAAIRETLAAADGGEGRD